MTPDELEVQRILGMNSEELIDYIIEHPVYLTDSYYRKFMAAISNQHNRNRLRKLKPGIITEVEACVIEAAQELAQCWEGSKYGPLADQVRKAEAALTDAVSALAAENEGRWRNPY